MGQSQRDAGLLRAVGTWGLAANIINMVVGAGIFAVPGALAASAGAYAPLAFLAGGVAIGAVAICFAEGGSRIPTSGGAYGYIESAFGPLAGYVSGTLLWVSEVLACGGVAAALADALVVTLPPRLRMPAHAAAIVCVIAAIAAINMKGVSQGARLINVATVVKLLPLMAFIVVGAWAVRGSNFATMAQPDPHGMGRGLILALFAFTGMEGSLIASGEVREPSRTIPRALGIAIGSVIALYVAIQIIAQGILGSSLSLSTVPLVDAMARISPAMRALLLAGTVVSMLGWLASDLLASPRMLFAFGRDGLLPRALGRIHPRTHAPVTAITCYGLLAMGLALTGTFEELAVLAMLATAVVYISGCAAAWQLARRGVAEAGTPLNFRWLGAAMVIGIASMVGMVAMASRAEIIGMFAAIGASAAIYVVQTWVRQGKPSAKAAARSDL